MDYIEVYILSKQKDVHLSNEEFSEIYKWFNKKFYKKYTTFNKQLLKTYHNNIILEEAFDDIHSERLSVKDTVYTLVQKPYEETIYGSLRDDNRLVKYYTKNTKPLHCFPSTNEIYDELFEDKIVVKINNRLYINFSKCTYKSNPKENLYYIYLNYNNNDKCDVKMNVETMREISRILERAS